MRKNYTIYKRSNKRCHENSNRREHGVSGCMTSGGTTINIICGMKYTTEMICGGGGAQRSERDFYIKVEKRNWREKKEENLRVLREKGRKRPPAAFKPGRVGTRNIPGTFPECSFEG